MADHDQRFLEYDAYLRRQHGIPVLPMGLYLRVGLNGVGWDCYEEYFWDHALVRFNYPYSGLPALDADHYLQGTNWLGVALGVAGPLAGSTTLIFQRGDVPRF